MPAFWALIESIPLALKLVQSLWESWEVYQLSKFDREYSSKEKRRKDLLIALGLPGVTDEVRKSILRSIYDLNK